MNEDFLQKLICLLKENKRFPKYQLERRFDILINLFLPDILRWYFGPTYDVTNIIPELPIKNHGNNQTTNIDYFVVCESQKTGFLIELKTDSNSCNVKQLRHYLIVQKEGFLKIKEGIRNIAKSTKKLHREKYKHLLEILSGDNAVPDIKLEIIYILPASGKVKLEKKFTDPSEHIHFITFESLQTMIPDRFQEEWSLIIRSGLVK